MIKKILIKIKDLLISPVNLLFFVINKPLTPRWMVFDITRRCNSRCIHCNIWKYSPQIDPLSRVEIRKVLSDPILKNLETVLLTGGEPALRMDLEEIILDIHQILPKVSIWLSTNGILKERVMDIVKKAAQSDIWLGIGVSLDAVGDKHDVMRGIEGNFKKADELIKDLMLWRKENGEKNVVSVGFTLSNNTKDFLKEVVEYNNKVGTELTVAIHEEGDFYHNLGENFTKGWNGFLPLLKLLPDTHHRHFVHKKISGQKIKFKCFALNRFFVLRFNGNVAPCLKLADLSAGNVKEKSPSEIWFGLKSKEIRRQIKKCPGCLNTWAVNWSFQSYNPVPLLYYSLIKRLNILRQWLKLC